MERKGDVLNRHQFRTDLIGEPDPAIFEREIRPKLKTVSSLETMQATGLSRTYCGMIRRGVRVPHQRHRDTRLKPGATTLPFLDG